MNGMELAFNTKDVIYIVGLVITGLTAWFKVKMDKQKMASEIVVLSKENEKAEQEYKEEVLNAKNGRRSMKKELTEMMGKTEQTLHQRIDRVRDDNIKSYEKLETKIAELDKKYDTSTGLILQAIQNQKK